MRYALLINELPGAFEALDADEQQAVSAEYIAIMSDPRVVGGAQLAPAHTASTVRVKDGDAFVTDAIQVAARVPAARLGGSVEIRPIVTPPSQ